MDAGQATDVPLEQRELTEYFTLLSGTRKHVTFVDTPSDPDAVLRLCEALSGDLERFRARPRLSTLVTANSPLELDGADLDIHLSLAAQGVPVEVYSMTIAGATSPVTLAGTVAQGLAEFLGIGTALQVAAPGARLIFCFGSGVLDMLRTTFALGSLESGVMAAMATEVGHYLGVPTLNPGLSTDAKHAGLQAGYEKAMKAAGGVQRQPGHGHRLGPHRLAQHHVPAAVGGRQRDRRHAAPHPRLRWRCPPPRWPRRGHRRGRAGRQLPRDTRTRPAASAPANTSCPPCRTASPTRSGPTEGRTENDTAREQVERLLAAHHDQEPYLRDEQLAELAAICAADDNDRRAWARHA